MEHLSLDLNIRPFRMSDSVSKEVKTDQAELKMDVWERKQHSSVFLMEELNRVSEENKKLTGMLTVMCENYNVLRNQLVGYMNREKESNLLKRKSESINNKSDTSSSTDEEESTSKKLREEEIKEKSSRVYVRTEKSDTSLLVKDGYQWRKYGQKVTRDNPCPRAYFKCSFAPSCPVKKKVQRKVEDQSILVAHYEGEHNHPQPNQMEATCGASRNILTSGSVRGVSSRPSTVVDATKSAEDIVEARIPQSKIESPEVPRFLVEQMVSSLTKDPNFTAALITAISGKIFPHTAVENGNG